jgi:hypothetical protein
MPKLLSYGSQRTEDGGPRAEGKSPKQEMREVIDEVKPKALRERLLKVWAKW